MKKRFLLIITIILALPLYTQATEPAAGEVIYDLEQCIALAMEKHPGIRAAAGTLKVHESRVGQAKANYYPQLNLSSGYQRIGPTSPPGESRDAYSQYSSNINLGMTLFDFGKTSAQVDIQTFNLNASRSDYESVKDQTVQNVKNAYYNLLQAMKNRDVAMDTLKQFQQHLDQARAFFRIGTKPKFDVTKAEVDLGNARLNVLKAENAVSAARITLRNVTGIHDDRFRIVDNLVFQKKDLAFTDVLNAAYTNRPDLRSAVAKRQAAERSIDLAQKDYYPTLSGSAGYGFSGTDFPLGRGWNAGATLSFPIFSGLSTLHRVEEAKANLEVLAANEESIRRAIRLEAEHAYLGCQDAAEQIAMAEMTVQQARENFELAEGRYRAGVGNSIEVADATIILNNARANLNTALYHYKIAQAALEKSIGADL